MKTVSLGLRLSGVGTFLAVVAVLFFPALRAQQNTGELDVGVRTTVDPDIKFNKKAKAVPVKITIVAADRYLHF